MNHLDQGERVTSRHLPNLKFEKGSYTLSELLESHLLPVVAQYDSIHQPTPFPEFSFDLSQPLLLYKKRNIQKVAARSMYIEEEKYFEVGETLLIPEDYKGWFAVLQRITGNNKADDTVPHFTTVEEIADSNTDRFLIGGTKKISGLQLLDRLDSQLKHEQRSFLPGDILTREKIYYGETKKRTRLFRKPKYITEKFLMCRDESDREILLPFEQTGIFYQISHKSGKPSKQVMQMSDIVARKLTPRILKLVFGRFPVTPCSFTGLMKAESSNIETTIIASTLINTKNILMEIPVSSAIYFRVAVMNNELRTNVCHRNAMSLCAERAVTYMRNIKVCFNLTTDEDYDNDDDWSKKKFNTDLQSTTVSNVIYNNNNNNNKEVHTLKTFKDYSETENTHIEGRNAESSEETDHTSWVKSFDSKPEVRRAFSSDIPDDVIVRPSRCRSAGCMSFCLGNSYLTVPMFEPVRLAQRDSGNNNTCQKMTYTTRRGSKISFNGSFFEEVLEGNTADDTNLDGIDKVEIPPPLSCTNVSSYVNVVPPSNEATDSVFPNYIPTSGSRRPSTQPPDMAPPPLPRSSSTNGVSSDSQSSGSHNIISKRESSDSFEYAVPKFKDPKIILSDLSVAAKASSGSSQTEQEQQQLRRPSTFTFSEGCMVPSRVGHKQSISQTIADIEETCEDGIPIYENIKKLMEIVTNHEDKGKHSGEQGDTSSNEGRGIDSHESEEEKEDEIKNAVNDVGISIDVIDWENPVIIDESELLSDKRLSNGIYEIETSQHTPGDSTLNEGMRNNNYAEKLGYLDVVARDCDTDGMLGTVDNIDNAENENGIHDRDIQLRARRIDVAKLDTEIVCQHHYVEESIIEGTEDEVLNAGERTDGDINRDEKIIDAENEHIRDLATREKSKSKGMQITIATDDCFEEILGVRDPVNYHNSKLHEDEDAFGKGMVYQAEFESLCHKIAINKRKFSNELMISKGKIRALEKPFHCLDVDEIAEELLAIGIKEATIEHMREMDVDGAKLTDVLDGEISIKECLSGVNLVDQQKISMFVRGWRPNNE